jgi:hypothetical protein
MGSDFSLYLWVFVQPLRLTLHQLAGLSLHGVRITQANDKNLSFVPSMAPIMVVAIKCAHPTRSYFRGRSQQKDHSLSGPASPQPRTLTP